MYKSVCVSKVGMKEKSRESRESIERGRQRVGKGSERKRSYASDKLKLSTMQARSQSFLKGGSKIKGGAKRHRKFC